MSVGRVAVEGLSLRLGDFALRDFGCMLEIGEVLVVLGPNGAGKSVSLEAIAGFHRLERGRVEIAGLDVTRLPPERRGVSLVFQNFGLFPHLSVARNVAFGKAGSGRRDPGALLDRFGIADLADRYPYDLSPGQKQRVALARAFAASAGLFLFDEPFSALDAPTRDGLREDLRAFLHEAQTPAIFVTHDRSDAGALADKILVLDRGEILQSGKANTVLARPASARVAHLLGIENLLAGHWIEAGDGGGRLGVAGVALVGSGTPASRLAIAAIRAEDVAVFLPDAPPTGDSANRLAGRVRAIGALGAGFRVRLDCGFPLVAHLSKRELCALALAPGRPVVAEIAADAVRFLSADEPPPAVVPSLAATRRQRRFGRMIAKLANPGL